MTIAKNKVFKFDIHLGNANIYKKEIYLINKLYLIDI